MRSAWGCAAQRGFEAVVAGEAEARGDDDLVGLRRMAGVKRTEGPAARTMATARWSSTRELDGRTISASTTRPAASTVTFIVSSP
jgi:hypothetical protein